jgi:hypothetical protein
LRRFEFDYLFLSEHRGTIGRPVVENIKRENEIKLELKNKNKFKKYSSANFENKHKLEENFSGLNMQRASSYDNANCNINSPYCIVDIENDFQHLIVTHLSFTIKSYPPKILENFYSLDSKRTSEIINFFDIEHFYNNIETNLDKESDILIHRRSHQCYHKKRLKNILNDVWTNQSDSSSSNYDDSFLKIYDQIKKDENFEKAKLNLSKTFKPKPFLEIEYENI